MAHTSARAIAGLFLASLSLACAGPDGIDEIRLDDLRDDLFALTGDATRGREGGTLDELDASVWLAERARDAGLEPAGDHGTYFQFFPLERFRVSAGSRMTLAGTELRFGDDVVSQNLVLARLEAPVLLLVDSAGVAAAGSGVNGRVVATRFDAGADAVGPRRSAASWSRSIQQALPEGATPQAVITLIPADQQDQWARVAFRGPRGSYALDIFDDQPPRQPSAGVPFLYVRESALPRPLRSGDGIDLWLFTESFTYPSVNVVARAPGRDPALAGEYVLFSGHQDHDGVRYAVEGDSIWNGADDNGTTSVALLAIGRAFVADPARRSALFVWHGSEERGLMGSRWYARHPTVPEGSIVAVLNGDMIGRNHPDTAALLGAVGPHRNSPEFVDIALAANEAVSGFVVDHSWDDPEHREGWYYRSDHLPYARVGIPALFFTTLLHEDYHTPFDNPDRIDLGKLTRMTRWMYETGRRVAEADRAPVADPDFELERCRDYTGNYCGG